jgi:UDP-N-acetylglucosamine transferase subunit ALG13
VSAKFNSTILVAPLDWGLGHSTRCIPLINYLLSLNCSVIIATDGAQEKLLKQEFPTLAFVQLQGYKIQYTSQQRFFALKILLQLPKIFTAILSEKKWLSKFVSNNKIDAVISDNRYGLHHPSIRCIFITHQLTVKAPFAFAEKLIQFFNYLFINKFKECWVPDCGSKPNIAGTLSHPRKLPVIPVKYLGGISRFEGKGNQVKEYELLIVISGPEPQRSVFEKKMLAELQSFKNKVLFVRGLPERNDVLQSPENVTFKNHLSATQMEDAFNKSEYIISRTGYTTVMDICKLQKKAILVPTPGQTEQEYLAKHLTEQGWCLTFKQSNFNLKEALEKATTFPFSIPYMQMDQYEKVLLTFINTLEK